MDRLLGETLCRVDTALEHLMAFEHRYSSDVVMISPLECRGRRGRHRERERGGWGVGGRKRRNGWSLNLVEPTKLKSRFDNLTFSVNRIYPSAFIFFSNATAVCLGRRRQRRLSTSRLIRIQ